MRRALTTTLAVLGAVSLLAACGEKPQTNAEGVKVDAAPWSGTANGVQKEGGGTAFTAQGWKVGDKASWQEELKRRAQNGQNEYTRTQ